MISKKSALIGVIAIVMVSWLLWHQLKPELLPVWVVAVEEGAVEASVANTRAGTVKACRRSKLSMPIGGVVDRLLVDEGDKVVADQLLLELWNRDRAADVEQAKQRLLAVESERQSACLMADLKAREAKRLEKLTAAKLSSEESLDSAATAEQAQKRQCTAAARQAGVAKAQLQFQQAMFERTQLRAPFSGVIAEINGEVGEYITPSPPGIPTPAAIDLIDYGCLYVTAPMDEVDASKIKIGLPARIALDAFRGQALQGRVTRISPYVVDLEKQARTVDVDVQFDSVPEGMTLLVGYSADITVVLERRESALRLPAESVLPDSSVWLLDEANTLHSRKIEIGMSDWSFTEVRSGLQKGERVVRNPDKAGLAEGVVVAVEDRIGND